jgi:hypothetical protein
MLDPFSRGGLCTLDLDTIIQTLPLYYTLMANEIIDKPHPVPDNISSLIFLAIHFPFLGIDKPSASY